MSSDDAHRTFVVSLCDGAGAEKNEIVHSTRDGKTSRTGRHNKENSLWSFFYLPILHAIINMTIIITTAVITLVPFIGIVACRYIYTYIKQNYEMKKKFYWPLGFSIKYILYRIHEKVSRGVYFSLRSNIDENLLNIYVFFSIVQLLRNWIALTMMDLFILINRSQGARTPLSSNSHNERFILRYRIHNVFLPSCQCLPFRFKTRATTTKSWKNIEFNHKSFFSGKNLQEKISNDAMWNVDMKYRFGRHKLESGWNRRTRKESKKMNIIIIICSERRNPLRVSATIECNRVNSTQT